MASSNIAYEVELPASTESTPLPKVFVLCYDATTFERLGGEDTLFTFSGPSSLVKVREAPVGILGVFRSETRAKIVGTRWLYRELDGELDPLFRVPYEWDDEPDKPPGSWLRSGNARSGWVNGVYWIRDLGRTAGGDEEVALGVMVYQFDLHEGEDEDMGDEEGESDGDEENEESDGRDVSEELAGFAASAA